MSDLKQKIEDLNLKEKWSNFTLKLDQIPVPKWVLVIITFVSVVVAIVSLVSGGSNTNTDARTNTSTHIKKSEDKTINGLQPGVEYVTKVDGWSFTMTLYNDGSARGGGFGGTDCEWYLKSIKDQKFVVVDPYDIDAIYYIDKNKNLYINSVNSKAYKLSKK